MHHSLCADSNLGRWNGKKTCCGLSISFHNIILWVSRNKLSVNFDWHLSFKGTWHKALFFQCIFIFLMSSNSYHPIFRGTFAKKRLSFLNTLSLSFIDYAHTRVFLNWLSSFLVFIQPGLMPAHYLMPVFRHTPFVSYPAVQDTL